MLDFQLQYLVSRKIRSVHGIPLDHESPPTLIIFPSYSNLIAPTKQSFSSSLKMSDTSEFNFSFSMKTSDKMSSYYTGESKTGLVRNVFLQTVYVRTLKRLQLTHSKIYCYRGYSNKNQQSTPRNTALWFKPCSPCICITRLRCEE